jgi:HNH endonuclease.
MGTPAKQLPDKVCPACGATFNRKRYRGTLEDSGRYRTRIYCSQSCANTRREVTKSGHHWRAQRHRKDSCQACSATTDLHVHHKDRDHTNNDPSNLMTLCASCHLRLHWREDRAARMDAAKRAAATAASRGANMRPRSADGRFASGDPLPTPQL